MWSLIIRAETLGRRGSLSSFQVIFDSYFVCCHVLIIVRISLVTGIPDQQGVGREHSSGVS